MIAEIEYFAYQLILNHVLLFIIPIYPAERKQPQLNPAFNFM